MPAKTEVSSEVKSLLQNSLNYNIQLLKKAIIELEARDKSPYYRYDAYRPNTDKYIRFHKSDKKIRVCKGAPRTGKTMMCIHEIVMHILGEHPFWHMKRDPEVTWVVATSFRKIRDVLMPMFKANIPMNRVYEIKEDKKGNDYWIVFDNGRRIVFKSQEEGVGAFSSAEVNIVLMDERVDNEDIRMQIRTRVISTDGYLIFTMDTFEEDEWVGDLSHQTYAEVFEFELRDNMKYLPKEELDRLEHELNDVDKERLIYGRHKARNREAVFDPSIFTLGNYFYIKPGRFWINGRELVPSEDGLFRIFKPREEGVNYVAGLDVAAGTGGNAHGLQVFSEYGEQVCTILNNDVHFVKLTEYLEQILVYYNNAMLVPENKAQGIYVSNKLAETYYNIYIDAVQSDPGKIKKPEFGIVTNERNKVEMINQTLADITNEKILIHDEMTKLQLQAFVKDEDERFTQKKSPKYHGTKVYGVEDLKNSDDDLVMALLFADRALNMCGYLKSGSNVKRVEKRNAPIDGGIIRRSGRTSWWSI